MVNKLPGSSGFTAPILTRQGVSDESIREIESSQTHEAANSEKQMEQLPKEKAEKLVESMNQFLASTNTSLKFNFHDKLHEYYVTIIDSKTEEIVREIPSKKLMDMYAAMMDFVGFFVDRKI